MNINVIHLKNFQPEDNTNTYFYIGRYNSSLKKYPNLIQIELGNPFHVKEYGRGNCIHRYRLLARSLWLAYQKQKTSIPIDPIIQEHIARENLITLEQANQFHQKIEQIVLACEQAEKQGTSVFLVCYCAPKPCHGDVIKEAVLKLIEKRKQQNSPKLK